MILVIVELLVLSLGVVLCTLGYGVAGQLLIFAGVAMVVDQLAGDVESPFKRKQADNQL